MKTKTTIIIFTITLLAGLALAGNGVEAQDYQLIKTATDAKVFLVKNDRRIHIPNEQVFEAGGYKWNEIETVSQSIMGKTPNTALIKSPVDAKVYLISEGKKAWIPNETAFLGAGLDWSDIVLINQPQVEFYSEINFEEDKAKEVADSISEAKILIAKTAVEEKTLAVENIDRVVVDDYKRPEKENIIEVGNLRPDEPRTTLLGINNKGEAVGHSMKTGANSAHPILFKDGRIIDIGNGRTGVAKAINDYGQVIGQISMSFNESTGGGVDHAFLWEGGVIKDLGGLSGKSYMTNIASDINNKGQVVGYSWIGQVDGFPVHAFLWENGKMIDIGTLGGSEEYQYTKAMAINDSSQIVGCSGAKDNSDHPFVWENGVMKDLGDKYGEGGCAVDINNKGEVLGYYRTGSGMRESFIWFEDNFEIIPQLRSVFIPTAINNNSEVIGLGDGLVYYKNGYFTKYRDVDGWFLGGKEGVDINDRGQIAGIGTKTSLPGNYGLIFSLPSDIVPTELPQTFKFTVNGENEIFGEEEKKEKDYPEFLAENPLKYKISWQDSDPHGSSKISLYYYYCGLNCQLGNFQGEGELLVNNISEDAIVDYYIWDMSQELPGAYYFYAEMDNGKNKLKIDSDRLKKIREVYSNVESEDEEVISDN